MRAVDFKGRINKLQVSPVLTACPGDAHFHRQSCVQSGTVDHDTQHPQPCGGACVQVREHGRVQQGVQFTLQHPNGLASNIEKILTSTSLFLCGHFLSTKDNLQFLKGMKHLVAKSGQKLKICYEYMNRGDRWMQVKPMRVCFTAKLYLHSSLIQVFNIFAL